MAVARLEILKKFRENIKAGIPVIGASAGIGLSARCEERGGVDFIIVSSHGENRMQGRPTSASMLPIYDVNETLLRLANRILPVVDHTPVIAGFFAQDLYRDVPTLLKQLKEMGFSGVQCSPSLGGFDASWGASYEDAGVGFCVEANMIKIAHEMDFLTTPFVHTPQQAVMMAEVGADILICNAGVSVGGFSGSTTPTNRTLDECVRFCQEIHDAAVAINPDIMVLCHGGRMVMPEDIDYVFQNTKGIVGYYGTSGIERIPTEIAISEGIRKYKNVKTTLA